MDQILGEFTVVRLSSLFPFFLFLSMQAVWAFRPNPDLLVISPCVAPAGSTIEVTVSGSNLEDLNHLRFSHPEIKVKPVLLPKGPYDAKPKSKPNTFSVEIPETVSPGLVEVRALGFFGLSTARPFLIVPAGSKEIQNSGKNISREEAVEIELETGILGKFQSQGFHWFKFSAKQGERILVEMLAQRLDSQGDGLLKLYDSSGRELESSRQHFGRDPFLDFTPHQDGTFFLAVADTTYKGGNGYFYHVRLTQRPHIDFVFPPAGKPGTTQTFIVFGRNLPNGQSTEFISRDGKPIEKIQMEIPIPAEITNDGRPFVGTPRQGLISGFPFSLKGSNEVRIGFAEQPQVIEDPKASAQTIQVPCEVAGRFDLPGDADSFEFQAVKGKSYCIEVISERMGSLTDTFVRVSQKNGSAKNTENDDPPTFYATDALNDLNADTRDSFVKFTAEADAIYRIDLFNQRAGGSPDHLYRLIVREPQPDFELLVTTERTKTINNDAYPAAALLRRGGTMVFRVIAPRKDGFEGEISVNATDLPDGVSTSTLRLFGQNEEGFLTLEADKDATVWSGPIQITGNANVHGKEIKHDARSASIVWGRRVFGNQAQVKSRLDAEITLAVMDHEQEPTRIRFKEKNFTVEMKKSLEIPFVIEDNGTRKGNMEVTVHGLPGVVRNPPKVSVGENDKEAKIKIDFKPTGNFKPVMGKSQFVLQAVGNAQYQQNPLAAKRAAEEVERLKQLEKSLKEKAAKLKQKVTDLNAKLTEAKKGGDKDAIAAADAALKEARTQSANANREAGGIPNAIRTAERDAKKLEGIAKEKSMQFATFSHPITIEVLPEKK